MIIFTIIIVNLKKKKKNPTYALFAIPGQMLQREGQWIHTHQLINMIHFRSCFVQDFLVITLYLYVYGCF